MADPLSGRVRALLAGYAVSCVGTGLVYPFTAVYLVTVRDLGPGAAGLFFGLIAAVSFCTAPFAGRLVDRLGPRVAGGVGVLVQASGYALLAGATTKPWALSCAVLIGLGNGTFYPSFTPVMAGLLDEDQRKRGFSYRYFAMNLGLGVGAATAGLLVSRVTDARAYELLYLLDGVSFVPLAVLILTLARRPAARLGSAAQAGRTDYRGLLRSRPLLLLLLIQTSLVLFGYSQLDTAVPLLLTSRVGLAADVVGLMIAVNTVAVVLLQVPLGRLLERWASPVVLTLCAVVWAVAAVCGLAVVLASGAWRIPLLLVFAVVFAVGETGYAVSYQPLLTELTPPELLGRASALSSLSWNTGAMAGPAIGLAVVGAAPAVGYWAAYGAALAVTALPTYRLLRLMPRAAEAGSADGVGTGTADGVAAAGAGAAGTGN